MKFWKYASGDEPPMAAVAVKTLLTAPKVPPTRVRGIHDGSSVASVQEGRLTVVLRQDQDRLGEPRNKTHETQ